MVEHLPLPGDHPNAAENRGDGLTRIRDAYTLARTPDSGSEINQLMIRNFLNTLAEVALSVASRNLEEKQEGGS
ncbi:MAG: hypothetical protein PHV74_08405 [Dehalococcoidia bacterium]|nr:hypothetical protein [Dehalococcoidia bacterium]